MTQILFVLGMHRSGTSALARVLSFCGARMPADLVAPAADNPTGFWESKRVVEINNQFLAAHDITTVDPCLISRLESVGPDARARFRSAIADFLKNLKGAVYVIKDPRLCLVMSDWRAAALTLGCDVNAIHIYRNQYEVAASLGARDRLTPSLSLALWMNYNLLAERDTRGLSRLFVTFEDLLSDWEAVVERCIEVLPVRLRVTASGGARIGAFLSPDLRHHNGDQNLNCPLIEQRARATFALLSNARRGDLNHAVFDEARELVSQLDPQFAEEAARRAVVRARVLRDELRRLKGAAQKVDERLAKAEGAMKRKSTEYSRERSR